MTRREYRRADPEAAGISAGAGARSFSEGLATYPSTSRVALFAFAGVGVASEHRPRRGAVRLRRGGCDISCRAVAGLAPDLHYEGSRSRFPRQLWMDRNLRERKWTLGERADRLRLSDPGPIPPLSPPPSRSGGNISAAQRTGIVATR